MVSSVWQLLTKPPKVWVAFLCLTKYSDGVKEKYSDELCSSTAKLYATRGALKKACPQIYMSMYFKGTLDKHCAHMVAGKRGMPFQHTFEDLAAAFKRHTTLGAVKRGPDSRFYRVAWDRYGTRSEEWKTLTAHMEPPMKFVGHLIYAIEFSDSHAYVGQTLVSKRRFRDHQEVGPVRAHLDANPDATFATKVLEENIWSRDVKAREGYWQTHYEAQGWTPLWSADPGGLGRLTKTTREQAHQAALQCTTRNEFWTRFQSIAKLARKRGWFDEITAHLPEIAPVSEETRQKQSEAAKARPQRTPEEMARMNEASQKSFAKKREVLKALAAEAKVRVDAAFKEALRQRFLAHNTRKSLLRSDQSAYVQAKRHGWYEEFCAHMPDRRKVGCSTPAHAPEIALKSGST